MYSLVDEVSLLGATRPIACLIRTIWRCFYLLNRALNM